MGIRLFKTTDSGATHIYQNGEVKGGVYPPTANPHEYPRGWTYSAYTKDGGIVTGDASNRTSALKMVLRANAANYEECESGWGLSYEEGG